MDAQKEVILVLLNAVGGGRLKRRGGNGESQAEVGEGEEVKKLCRARQEEGSTTRQIGMGGHTSKHGTLDAGTVQCSAVQKIQRYLSLSSTPGPQDPC